MARRASRRQGLRAVLLMVSFVAFPVTMNYFSPYLSVEAALQGIVAGSLLVFGSMFAGSLVVGRVWCGWMCPVASMQESLVRANDKRVGRRADMVKWAIWVPWVALIAFAFLRSGGVLGVDPLYGTVGGISVAGDAERPVIAAYAIYFAVVSLFFGLTWALGRRAGCHSVCWMAPFMISGRAIRNTVNWPSLRLAADRSKCEACGRCTAGCPMGLDVRMMLDSGSMEHPECVLCGTCADVCPNRTIRFRFSAGK